MKNAFPYILFAVSAALFFGPFPAFVYLIMPCAEGTKDPDAIEAVAWFFGIFLILIGVMLAPAGFWLYVRRQPE